MGIKLFIVWLRLYIIGYDFTCVPHPALAPQFAQILGRSSFLDSPDADDGYRLARK